MPANVASKWKEEQSQHETGSSTSKSSRLEAFDERRYPLPLNRGECVLGSWINGMDRDRLSLGFVGEIDIVPCPVMERWVFANVIGPAGREHEEGEVLFFRREP